MATYRDWQDAYEEVYNAIPRDPGVACPNCGHRTLRLVFTGDLDRYVGYGEFWCDTCLQGISISRASIPEGATVKDINLPDEAQPPEIPEYRLVRPGR